MIFAYINASKAFTAVAIGTTFVGASVHAQDGLPDPGFEITKGNTALLVTDPQNDFRGLDGAAWGVVGANVEENGTVENIEALFETAKETGLPVFVSPHYYFPHDHGWHMEGVLEALMHEIDKVIIAGMSANLCTESHMRALNEQGFEVMVVTDATAGAQLPGLDGYAAAMTNFRMIASHTDDTQTVVAAMAAAAH